HGQSGRQAIAQGAAADEIGRADAKDGGVLLDLGTLRRGQPGIEPVLAFLLRCFSRSRHTCPPPRFLPFVPAVRGVQRGFPSARPARLGPGFWVTKNTSGYPDQGTAGLGNASVESRGNTP